MMDIKDDRTKLDGLLRELKKGYKAKVGILKGDNERSGDSTNATIGMKHEFGSYSDNIPQRSFIRTPLNEKLSSNIKKNIDPIKQAFNNLDFKQAYVYLGITAEQVIQEAFDTNGYGKWKPLSAKTIAEKGSSQILVDTGQLKRSISSEVVND